MSFHPSLSCPLQESCQTSGDHLRAGIIGFSSGVFGGVTSIFTQPYRGAMESGVGVSGFGGEEEEGREEGREGEREGGRQGGREID